LNIDTLDEETLNGLFMSMIYKINQENEKMQKEQDVEQLKTLPIPNYNTNEILNNIRAFESTKNKILK
jgi:hypothetical protein